MYITRKEFGENKRKRRMNSSCQAVKRLNRGLLALDKEKLMALYSSPLSPINGTPMINGLHIDVTSCSPQLS